MGIEKTKQEILEQQELNQKYDEMVKKVTPENNMWKNMLNAFLIGGAICLMGQVWLELFMYWGATKDEASSYTTIVLILESVVLTGLNIYPKIAKVGGAGTLVPITGFANGVVSPAIEFKAEGWVFGVGCKIFSIAGPVILYGILTSWVLGLGYWILKLVV